jgi:hypothetical protein
MRAAGLQELEELAARLLAIVRELPPGQRRYNIAQQIRRFRAQIIALQGAGSPPTVRWPRAKGKSLS